MVQYSKNITRDYEFPDSGEVNTHAHYYPCRMYQAIFFAHPSSIRHVVFAKNTALATRLSKDTILTG